MEVEIKIAVIGCGYWGPNHIRVLRSLEGAHLVAVVDRDPAACARARAQYPDLAVELDHRWLLSDQTIKAVVVATQAASHYGIVRDLLEAGKHVLCEKPFGESSDQARELVRLARARGVVLMTGYVFLFNPGIEMLKHVVDREEFGGVRHLAAIRTSLGPIRRDVNAAGDLAAHDISIFNWLTGARPYQVSARGAAYLQTGIEDVVNISLVYPNDTFASIYASWLSPVKIRSISVVGQRQMAVWDDSRQQAPVRIYDKGAAVANGVGNGRAEITTWDITSQAPDVSWVEPLRAQAEYFFRQVRQHSEDFRNAEDFRSSGRFAVEVSEVLEAVRGSMERGGEAYTVDGGAAK